MIKDIAIIGAGGLAKEVAFLINEINKQKKQWNIIGFIDCSEKNIGKKLNGISIIGTDDWLISQRKSINIVFGIGDPSLRRTLSSDCIKNKFINLPNLIHPNVIGDWNNISLGIGNVICAGNSLTTSINIGSFNYINLSCTIAHDSVIGDNNVINPAVNISGGVEMENEILIGTGSKILQYLHICSNCVIGSGSVVTKIISKPGTYFGIPAKRMFSFDTQKKT